MLIRVKINGLVLIVCLLIFSISGPVFALRFDSRPITPIPVNPTPTSIEAKKIALGKQLFNDTQLSKYKNLSCASCHVLKTGGTQSALANGVNIPSIFNTQYNFKQFWNASAGTLEQAIEKMLLDPKWMGFNPKTNLTNYKKLDTQKIVTALAAYIRTLNTPHSRFDKYLAGDNSVLSPAEHQGYALFKTYGCISCHQGLLIGGNIMARFGIYHNGITKTTILESDLGYYHVTKNPADKFVFKVPSLRNIALRKLYFHDGSMNNLNMVIEKMAIDQIGRPIPQEDIKSIVEFLYTLTGQIPET